MIHRIFISFGRILRIEFTIWSAYWFLQRWVREVAILVIVFPLVHFSMSRLFVQIIQHRTGDEIPDDAFRNVGSAMIHLNPSNVGIYTDMPSEYQVFVFFIVLYWVMFLGRAIIFSIKDYLTRISPQQDKALAEALWACELQICNPVLAQCQDFQDSQAGAEGALMM